MLLHNMILLHIINNWIKYISRSISLLYWTLHVLVMVDHPQMYTYIIINILHYIAECVIKIDPFWSYSKKSSTTAETSYTGKHATDRKKSSSHHGTTYPPHNKYPDSQKSVNLHTRIYNDHIEVLQTFSTLRINIFCSAYIYIYELDTCNKTWKYSIHTIAILTQQLHIIYKYNM
jgi:hypothetical protein